MPEAKTTKPVKMPASKGKSTQKRVEGLKRFFVETRAEFNKIVWPAPKLVLRNTVVVLVCIFAVGIVIWCLDAVSSSVLNAFLNNY
jgi:preprotein translocase subunit SecE